MCMYMGKPHRKHWCNDKELLWNWLHRFRKRKLDFCLYFNVHRPLTVWYIAWGSVDSDGIYFFNLFVFSSRSQLSLFVVRGGGIT